MRLRDAVWGGLMLAIGLVIAGAWLYATFIGPIGEPASERTMLYRKYLAPVLAAYMIWSGVRRLRRKPVS